MAKGATKSGTYPNPVDILQDLIIFAIIGSPQTVCSAKRQSHCINKLIMKSMSTFMDNIIFDSFVFIPKMVNLFKYQNHKQSIYFKNMLFYRIA